MSRLPGEKGQSPVADAHVHLDLLERAADEVEAAGRLGVQWIVGVCMGEASVGRTLELARLFPGRVLPALGLHPWEIRASDAQETLGRIEAQLDLAVAVGEIGLDYAVKTSKPLQKAILRRQLKWALERDLPAIIHCRYSHQSTLEILREMRVPKAVFHWYSGPLETLDALLSAGYLISATPALAYSEKHQEAVRRAPLERILLETDSPVAYRGKEAVPSDVVGVCRSVADLKGCPAPEVAHRTSANLRAFLSI
ncbi:MAG: TatD family hydrolase [bacterium]